MEISDVRRRLRGAIEKARQDAAERRVRVDTARRDYEQFLAGRAIPIFQQLSLVLQADNHAFKVSTPSGSVRLTSDRSAESFVEIVLDDTGDQPHVIGRSSRGRGRRMVASERPIRGDVSIADLSEDDVLSFVLEEIVPLL